MIINFKTRNMLGFIVPRPLLGRADGVDRCVTFDRAVMQTAGPAFQRRECLVYGYETKS